MAWKPYYASIDESSLIGLDIHWFLSLGSEYGSTVYFSIISGGTDHSFSLSFSLSLSFVSLLSLNPIFMSTTIFTNAPATLLKKAY